MMNHIHIALVHHPVLRGDSVITSSVTNMDLHDISRLCCTFGIGSYFVVQPDSGQQHVVGKLLYHWKEGDGSKTNPDRKKAVELIKLTDSVDSAKKIITGKTGENPIVVATTAREKRDSVPLDEIGFEKKRNILLLFGTADGLAPELIENSDCIAEPIKADTGYNHLSVRSAVSIFIDRLSHLCIM
ncbi:MAG: RNA methyltransferase [bacterium]